MTILIAVLAFALGAAVGVFVMALVVAGSRRSEWDHVGYNGSGDDDDD